jgi:hypothetical protein
MNKKNKLMRSNVVVIECRADCTDETMVFDDRDSLAPAEMVQRRLNEIAGEVPGARGRLVTSVTGRRPERSL